PPPPTHTHTLSLHDALPILPPTLAQDPSFVERFAREATLSAELRHPNIVAIHDFGEEEGFHYIVMELVEGVSLRDLIKAQGPMRSEEHTSELQSPDHLVCRL